MTVHHSGDLQQERDAGVRSLTGVNRRGQPWGFGSWTARQSAHLQQQGSDSNSCVGQLVPCRRAAVKETEGSGQRWG